MAGFLDPKEQVIDMVLTDVGKSLLMKGDLFFAYWIPFDDEVDYFPQTEPRVSQTLEERAYELMETPLTREATLGYKGLNFAAKDTTNVIRPMFTAPPGVGHSFPIPRMGLNTGSLTATVQQKKITKIYTQEQSGEVPATSTIVDGGFMRFGASEAQLNAGFAQGVYPDGTQLEGFLVTVYHSQSIATDPQGEITGGYEEILNNFDSAGNIVYRNDLKVRNYTP